MMRDKKRRGRSPPDRKVFVVRFWWVSVEQQWRCELQDVSNGEVVAFVHSELFLEHVRRHIVAEVPAQPNSGLR